MKRGKAGDKDVVLKVDLDKLKKWRGDRTYDEVAKLCGMSRSMFFMIESGDRSDIRISTLGKIARAMGVEPEALLKEE
jgi:transcriptional regulator with XRE-family HTH domain